MLIRIVRACGVCGGWGRFLNTKCPQCKGRGGSLLKATEASKEKFREKKNSLSEQEQVVFDLYQKGLTKREIARNLDIQEYRVIPILVSLQKKLNRVDAID